jgi:LytS/YehU family sensor histidine kinase
MVYLAHRLFPNWQHALRQRLLTFAILIPLGVLLTTAFQGFFFYLLNRTDTTPGFYIHYEDIGMNLLYTLIIIVFLELLYYFRNWTTALKESAALQRQNIETQLHALTSQISPHFLFNSLNSLASLIPVGPEAAVVFVHKLAGIYRYLLQTHHRHLVTLKEELEFLHAYLHLLQIRFGQALHYTIKVDPFYHGYFVPPITLQLLIENAVKHNIISVDMPLHLSIIQCGDELVVQNNLQKKKSPVISDGVGLVNLIARYQLITSVAITVEETADIFVVTLPLLKSNSYEGIDR